MLWARSHQASASSTHDLQTRRGPPKPCQPSFALGAAEGNLGSYSW